MAAIVDRKTELFDEVLRSLSVAGFSLIVSHGVRDIDAFLSLDLEALPDISPRTVAELSSAQHSVRQRLSAAVTLHEECPVDDPGLEPESNCSEDPPMLDAGNEDECLEQNRDDQHLFQVVLDVLGMRACSALLHNWIRDMAAFLALKEEELASFQNCGRKAAQDILVAQERTKRFVAWCSEQRRAVTSGELCDWLLLPKSPGIAQTVVAGTNDPHQVDTQVPSQQVVPEESMLGDGNKTLREQADTEDDEETGGNGGDRPSESEEHDELLQAALGSLGVHARNILANHQVSDLASFLALDTETLAAVPGSGAKTTAEIVAAQGGVRNFLSRAASENRAIDPASLAEWLARTGNRLLSRPHYRAALLERVRQRVRRSQQYVPTPVEHRVDDPARWSVLRHTLLDLFQLNVETQDMVWDAASLLPLSTLGLPDEEWAVLAAAGVFEDDQFDSFLAFSIGYIVNLGIAPASFEAILDALSRIIETCSGSRPSKVSSALASEEAIVAQSEVAGIRGLRIDSFDVPEDLADDLREMGVTTWADLTKITERGALDSSSDICLCTFSEIRHVWRTKLYAQRANDRVSGLPAECFVSFERMMDAFIDLVVKTPREKTVLQGRMGLLENRRWTLEELGNLLGVTRERVRQLEAKSLKTLRKPGKKGRLAKLWLAVDETLRTAGGVRTLSEMAEQLALKLDWSIKPNDTSLISLLQFSRHIVDRQAKLVCNPHHRCYACEVVVSTLEDLFAEDGSERQLVDVAQHLLSACAQTAECARFSRSLSLSEGFVHFAARRTECVMVKDGVVYCRDRRPPRLGSRTQLVEDILRVAARPMHFTEVFDEARRLLPEDDPITEQIVYTGIGNSTSLLLWDRGTYVHRESVKIPFSLISEVESWLEKKLARGVPFVSVAGAFKMFGRRLRESGVPSGSALYSCLRVSPNARLEYPRYPYAISTGSERLPVSIALEQYVLESGGLVSVQEMKTYLVDELCVAEQLFDLHLYNVPNIVRAAKGSYMHVRNLKMDDSNLESIIAYAAAQASGDGHVSVAKVHRDRRIWCRTMGIDSPWMLYAILQSHPDDRLQTPGYPQIFSSDYAKVDGGGRGIINEVTDFVAAKGGPCSFDELERHFVNKLGYNAGTVYNVHIRDDVVRYSRGSLIHLDAIGWTDDKQHQLKTEAHDALAKAREAGRCYALNSHLVEYYELPQLGNSVVWTQTLLAELLERDASLRVLGSARNAFVRVPNGEGIETFEDLIRELLTSAYDGACDLESFESDMQEAGIVKKRVTPGMLGDQKKVCIDGHVIMLREVRDRA